MATVKSRLAQLLAQEDIRVQHLPVKTACFDMQNRILVCPIWHDMDGDLYDLCMGHEVGHALNTPAEGWHGALKEKGKGYQTYMNVVEDARIERKIKTMFPGLRAPFARAYKKLDERDMFEIRAKRINIAKCGLIDRLNVYYKLGHIYHVPFTPEERTYIDRIDHAETWQQVREIADELYARAKKRKDMLPQMPQSGTPGEGDEQKGEEQSENQNKQPSKSKSKKDKKESKKGDKSDKNETGQEGQDGKDGDKTETKKQNKPGKGKEKDPDEMTAEDYDRASQSSRPEDDENDYGDESESGESEDDGEGDDAEGSDSDDGSSEGGQDDHSDESEDLPQRGDDHHDVNDHDQSGATAGDYIHDHEPDVPDPISVTDEAFRKNEEQLVDNTSTAIRTLYLPDTKPVKDMIAPMDLVYKSIEHGVDFSLREFLSMNYTNDQEKQAQYTRDNFADLSVQEILKDNKKYIDLLVKEFELRKNASEYSRQLTAKTGELDVNRLHQYKFTNDLFKKVTTVQKGKSHGMVFFLDMSSSMQDIMGHTVKQLLVLVTFCKRVGIPFDVYGFSDGIINGFNPRKFHWMPDTVRCENRNFHLKHLISSSCRPGEYRRAFAALAMYSNVFYGQTSATMKKFIQPSPYISVGFSEHRMNMGLSGTPYNKMLLASRQIIEDFRNSKGVDIVNVIHLTDGDGTDHMTPPGIDANDPNYSEMIDARIAYTDRKTQLSVLSDNTKKSQEILTMMVKQITGCRHIAFYVGQPTVIKNYVDAVISGYKEKEAANKSIKDFGFFRSPHLGYDSYYYVGVAKKASENMSDNNNQSLEDRFIDSQREKAKSRNIARQFCIEISEQIKRND